jgi:hypothetical protein
MTNEKENNNAFRFVLTQGNVLLCETTFDADKFNPFTRYSINIRDILPRAITKLQKTLSKNNYNTQAEHGNYELYTYVRDIMNSYPQQIKHDLKYNPQPIVQQIEEKTIRGVECKIGFYINENPIVERIFYVDGFNPIARWSVDIVDATREITREIRAKIVASDEKNMWDDYDLINYKGMSINQIRELSTGKREEILRKLKR